MIKAAAYARYSTDNQTNNSIEYQLDKIKTYCKNNDIEIVMTFCDEAQSGTNTQRAEFQRMLSAAHAKLFDAVVIYDITRGSRDVADWFNFRKEMRTLRISVISVENNLGDPLNPNDFLIELMNVGLGQHHVLSSRQKSIDGVAIKAKQAVFLGGIAPLGYDIVDGKYVVNESEATIVRKIFAMYGDGKSYNSIIDALKGCNGKKGRPFGKNSIQSILRNDRYIGTYTWNRRICKQLRKWAGGVPNPNVITIEDAIPALIDDNTWCICQRRLNSRERNASNKAKRTYLLSGLIKCASCGSSYVGNTTINGRGVEYQFYSCGERRRTRTCTSSNIPLTEIESFVLTNLKEYLAQVDINSVSHDVMESLKSTSPNIDKEKAELLSVETKINNAVNAILDGIDVIEIKDKLQALKARKIELENSIASSACGQFVSEDLLREYLYKKLSAWEYMDDIALVKSFVLEIKIQPNGDYTVSVGIVNTNSSERGI